MPLALTEGRGQSATVAGIALTAATIFWSTGAWVQAHLDQRLGRAYWRGRPGSRSAWGLPAAVLALSPAVPVWAVLAAWGLAGLGMGMAFSSISLVVLATAPAYSRKAPRPPRCSWRMWLLSIALGTGLGGVPVAAASARTGSPNSGLPGAEPADDRRDCAGAADDAAAARPRGARHRAEAARRPRRVGTRLRRSPGMNRRSHSLKRVVASYNAINLANHPRSIYGRALAPAATR
ncbi:MAG: hypothetical protein U0Z44_20640 [Kouleothrix sp.]